MVPTNLDLGALNKEQQEAVLHGGGPLLVLAGAGTGKTRVIVYRIARLIESGVPADRILAVTFTNKAAEEMRRRVSELVPGAGSSVWVHTFHAFACRLLRRHHQELNLPKYFTIYDEGDQKRLIVESMKELGLGEQTSKAGVYVGIIARAKDDLLDAGSYSIYAMTGSDLSRQTAARIYAVYQKKLEAAGALDFGDLLLKTCLLLKERQQVRAYYQEYFLHLLVDEYQDTNHAQYTLTKTLAAKHRNVCVVGDDDQSVYSWRGANVRNILEFEKDFGETKVVTVEQNYRSTSSILDAAVSVIRHNKARKPKTLWTQKEAGEAVTAIELPNEFEESRWVTSRLRELVSSGGKFSDAAIFYRTNAQSRSFEEALGRAGIPHVVVGAMRFYERKEIKDLLAYARLAVNPADSAALLRVLNVPPRGIGKTSQEALLAHSGARDISLMDAFRDSDAINGLTAGARRAVKNVVGLADLLSSEAGKPPSQALEKFLELTGYWAWLETQAETDPEANGRMNNLQELVNAAREYEEKARAEGTSLDLGAYLEGIALHAAADNYDASAPAVTLMTVHLAKGLEFPTVFLTGLEEGLFPIGGGNSSESDLEEERRLCYVGMTRARKKLNLTYAATRRLFGHVYANLPSRFVLEAELYRYAGGAKNGESAPEPVSEPAGFTRGAQGAALAPPSGRPRAAVFRGGMRVRHPSFGTGTVLEKSGAGEMLKVTVRFDSGRTTKLLVRYAPLEPA